MICKNCKKEIDDNNFLCPYCSYNVAKQAEEERKKKEKEHEKEKKLKIINDFLVSDEKSSSTQIEKKLTENGEEIIFPSKKRSVATTGYITFFIMGFFWLAFAIFWVIIGYFDNKDFDKLTYNFTIANLLKIEKKENQFYGIYKYTVDDIEYEFTIDELFSNKKLVENSKVVKYSKENPSNVLEIYKGDYVYRKRDDYAGPMCLVIISLIFFGIGKIFKKLKR